MNLDTLAIVLVIAASIPAILLPIVYFFGSPWKTTLVGKMMMNKMAAIGVVFALILVGVVTGGDYPGRDWIRVVAYAYLAIALWAQLVLLLRIQRDSRRGILGRADLRTTPDKERSA